MQITLERLLYSLTNLAIKEKLVNYAAAGASFNGINSLTVRDYPLIFLQPNGQHKMEEDFTTYSLNMYFVDRLSSDDSNDVSIYSTAIEVLRNFIRKIKEQSFVVDLDDTIYVENFVDTQGKNDRCAGCVAHINIKVLNDGVCYEE